MDKYIEILEKIHENVTKQAMSVGLDLPAELIEIAKGNLNMYVKQATTHLNNSEVFYVYASTLNEYAPKSFIFINNKELDMLKDRLKKYLMINSKVLNKKHNKDNKQLYNDALNIMQKNLLNFVALKRLKFEMLSNALNFKIEVSFEESLLASEITNCFIEVENLSKDGLSYSKQPKFSDLKNIAVKADNKVEVEVSRPRKISKVKKSDKKDKIKRLTPEDYKIERQLTGERLKQLYTGNNNFIPNFKNKVKLVEGLGFMINYRNLNLLITYKGIVRTDFNIFVFKRTSEHTTDEKYLVDSFKKEQYGLSNEEIKEIMRELIVANNHRMKI